MHTLSNSQNYFVTYPFLNDQFNVIFELLDQPDNFFFSLETSGINAFENLTPFCIDKSCSIPMIIGGQLSFEIYHKKQKIYSDFFELPQLTINCTNDPWTNRI